MTRTQFIKAYRMARISLNTFASHPRTEGRYANMTADQRRAAEERWIAGVAGPYAAAYLAAANSFEPRGTTSNAAIHDFRFCGGGRKQWYLRMARDRRARCQP